MMFLYVPEIEITDLNGKRKITNGNGNSLFMFNAYLGLMTYLADFENFKLTFSLGLRLNFNFENYNDNLTESITKKNQNTDIGISGNTGMQYFLNERFCLFFKLYGFYDFYTIYSHIIKKTGEKDKVIKKSSFMNNYGFSPQIGVGIRFK